LTHAFNDNWWITNSFSTLLIDSRRFYVSGPDSTFSADKTHISRTILDLPETSQAFFQRLDTVGKFGTGPVKHTLLFGIEVSRERFHRALYRYPIDSIDLQNPVYGLHPITKPNVPQVRDQGADIGGAYVQEQISLFKQLKLLVGVRYDLSKTPYRDYSPGNLNEPPGGGGVGPGTGVPGPGSGGGGTGPSGTGPGTNTAGGTGSTGSGASSPSTGSPSSCGAPRPDPVTGEYTQCSVEHPRAFSPRAGLLYQRAKTISLYFSYSKSFNPLQLQQYLNFQFLKPFIGKQAEAGAKFDLLQSRLQITTAVYRIVHSGLPIANPGQPGGVVYSGFRRSEGAELDITAQLLPGWSIASSYGYNLGFVKSAFPTNKLLGAPKHSGNVWTVYEFSRSRFKGWSAGVGASYTGIRNGNQFASFNLPAYTRADAMLAYRRQRWSLQLNVKNLTNTRYFDTDAIQGLVYPGSPTSAEGAIRVHF
jgi:outer membrane receptor protein involved in Fe transport